MNKQTQNGMKIVELFVAIERQKERIAKLDQERILFQDARRLCSEKSVEYVNSGEACPSELLDDWDKMEAAVVNVNRNIRYAEKKLAGLQQEFNAARGTREGADAIDRLRTMFEWGYGLV